MDCGLISIKYTGMIEKSSVYIIEKDFTVKKNNFRNLR